MLGKGVHGHIGHWSRLARSHGAGSQGTAVKGGEEGEQGRPNFQVRPTPNRRCFVFVV